MNYLLGQLVWRGDEHPRWEAPDVFNDKVLDLRNLGAQAQAGTIAGHVLIATDRDPLPGETLLAGAGNELLRDKARDAVKDLLGIPESITAQTLPDLVRVLLGVYSDPDAQLICPPLMPDSRGRLRFRLGEIGYSEKCPKSGTHFDNILKVLHAQYRGIRQQGGDLHRKFLSVWRDKFGIENHEVFIPSDLPKETPVRPTTTLRDNFNVGDHTDISGQASSDGWLWNKLAGSVTALVKTNTGAHAEATCGFSQRCTYRADADLSSVDHYVQAIMSTSSNSMTPILMARKDSSATMTFYECQLGAFNDVLWLLKLVAGTGTVLGTRALTINTGTDYTIKFLIDGSTLQAFNSGSQVGSDLTDTAIAGGTRCGMTGQVSGASTLTANFEDFEAADLIPSAGEPVLREQIGVSDRVSWDLINAFTATPPPEGIYFSAQMDDTPEALETYTGLRRGALGVSLGIQSIRARPGGEYLGRAVLDIESMRIGHIAFTPKPACPTTWAHGFDRRYETTDSLEPVIDLILVRRRLYEAHLYGHD